MPERSTAESWWASAEEGGEGLVPMSFLQPISSEERMAQLKEEAAKVAREWRGRA